MATNVTYNGVTYSVPQNGNSGWGTQLTAYLVALASGSLTKAGGVVTLTANLDLGANYGIKSIFFSDRGTAASAGIFRLSNNTAVSWRNAANDGNLDLTVNSSNVLMFNSLPIAALALGAANTVLKMNSGGTAFEYGTLVNANINASAAIAYSKLAALTSANILVGSAGNVATSVAMTGDVTISNAGVTAIGSGVIVNADISASAAIDGSKLVAATGSVAGAVTTSAQTFAGAKTFSDLMTLTAGINLGDGGTLVLKDTDGSTGADERIGSLLIEASDTSNTSLVGARYEARSLNSGGATSGFRISASLSGTETTLLESDSTGALVASNLVGTSTRMVTASSAGVLAAATIVTSGTYTPTFTLSNATDGVARQNNYTRIGNIVHVTGVIDGITTTTTATDVSITLTSLPVATANFSSAYRATGSGKYGRSTGGINEAMSINANSGAQTVVLQVESTSSASAGGSCFAYYSFSYQIQ